MANTKSEPDDDRGNRIVRVNFNLKKEGTISHKEVHSSKNSTESVLTDNEVAALMRGISGKLDEKYDEPVMSLRKVFRQNTLLASIQSLSGYLIESLEKYRSIYSRKKRLMWLLQKKGMEVDEIHELMNSFFKEINWQLDISRFLFELKSSFKASLERKDDKLGEIQIEIMAILDAFEDIDFGLPCGCSSLWAVGESSVIVLLN